RLTQQLLTFSRGGITEPQSVDLAKTLQALVPMLESVLGSGNRLDVQLPGTPVFVKGSASALDQLLMNLVGNGGDAAGSSAHESSTMTTQEGAPGVATGEHAYLRVSDNGPGIPA